MVSGTGSTIFTITQPITIDLQGATLSYFGASNTTSMFTFAPTSTGDFFGGRLTRGNIAWNTHGLATVAINTSATNLTEVAELEIDHIIDSSSGGALGYSIDVVTPSTNTTGGIFHANFHDNILWNGIFLSNAGDSIRIKDNILTGNKYGLYANLISGAGGLIFTGNNDSAASPFLLDNAQGNVVINNNEFEQQRPITNPDTASVDIRGGGGGSIGHVTFIGNSINVLPGQGNPYPLFLGNISLSYIESNVFTSATPLTPCIQNAAPAITVMGATNQFYGCTITKFNLGGGSVSTVTTHVGFP